VVFETTEFIQRFILDMFESIQQVVAEDKVTETVIEEPGSDAKDGEVLNPCIENNL
jgi:hypothetical protein